MKNSKGLFFVIAALIIVLAGLYIGLKGRTVASIDKISKNQTLTNSNVSGLLAFMNFSQPAEKIFAPDFTLASLDGNRVSLSQYNGKVVLISFWATW